MSDTTFIPAPWWRCLFRRWSEPEFVQLVGFRVRQSGRDWEPSMGSLYRQTHRRTGKRRYNVVMSNWGDHQVDTAAWENHQTLIFA